MDLNKKSDEIESQLFEVCKQFNMVVVKREIDRFEARITFQNEVAGVQVLFSPREGNGWLTIVTKLLEGRFPKHPMFINKGTLLLRFDIRDIASLRLDRIIGIRDKVKNGEPLTGDDIAELLLKCCPDILNGDFSIFKEAEVIVKNRVK